MRFEGWLVNFKVKEIQKQENQKAEDFKDF
ncbi:Uncharacterised protein [Helicobacter mustelae]|nr:Uncharacterised protein [Helicobacter mustelae]STP12446.1 Uncharacterised protein [Helicobacter mustelae]